MLIRRAGPEDSFGLAALRWNWNAERGMPTEPLEHFAPRFAAWVHSHRSSHEALVAVEGDGLAGMAWLATLDRLPDPGSGGDVHGDVQSVYVSPAMRGGLGSQLMRAVIARATDRGIVLLSVHPGRRSWPFYRRLGFAGEGEAIFLRLPVAASNPE